MGRPKVLSRRYWSYRSDKGTEKYGGAMVGIRLSSIFAGDFGRNQYYSIQDAKLLKAVLGVAKR